METLLLLVYISIASLVVATLWMRRRGRRYNSSLLPPGPFAFPVVGNIPHLMMAGAARRHRYLAGLAKKYGPIFLLRLASRPVIVVSSPSLARALLHTHDKTFASRPPAPQANLLVGHDFGEKWVVFHPYSTEWKAARKTYINHMFTPHHIEEFHSGVVSREIRRLIQTHLIPACNAGHAINLSECLGNLMVDIMICCCIVDRRLRPNECSTKSTVICRQRMEELGELLAAPLIGEFLPALGFLDYNAKASMQKWYSWFDDFTEKIVAEREEKKGVGRSNSKELVEDILDALLLPENKLSRGLVKARIMELLGAGVETTSTAIDWGMAELLSNPSVMGKLRDELNSVVGRERDVVEVSDIPHLPYLRAVVKETFRMHPPGPLLVPHMSHDVCEDVGGYRIPKGTMVLINLWAIGHDPDIWKDDPNMFLPDRFMFDGCNSSIDVKGKHFELLPFGSGRRICPGMSLALPTVEITLANLVHAFDDWKVMLPPGQHSLDMSDKCGLSCRRVHPLIVVPTKI